MLKISKQALSCPGPRCARSAGGIRCRVDPGAQRWLFISEGNFSGPGGALRVVMLQFSGTACCMNIPAFKRN